MLNNHGINKAPYFSFLAKCAVNATYIEVNCFMNNTEEKTVHSFNK